MEGDLHGALAAGGGEVEAAVAEAFAAGRRAALVALERVLSPKTSREMIDAILEDVREELDRA